MTPLTVHWHRTRWHRRFLYAYAAVELTAIFAIQDQSNLLTAHLIQFAILGIAMTWLAVRRMRKFHPIFQPEYAGWLALTPWRASQALPEGPILPTLGDFVMAAVLLALGLRHPNFRPDLLPLSFLAAYLCCIFFAFAAAREEPPFRSLHLSIVLFGASFLFIRTPWAPLAASLPLLGLLYALAPRTLANFPWGRVAGRASPEPMPPEFLCFPISPGFRFISDTQSLPIFVYVRNPLSTVAAFACLAFMFVSLAPREEAGPAVGLSLLISYAIASVLALAANKGLKAPLGFFGRFRTGVLWVPQHDAALWGLLLGPALAGFLAFVGFVTGLPAPMNAAVSSVALVCTVLGCGPAPGRRPLTLRAHLTQHTDKPWWDSFAPHPNTGKGVEGEPDDEAVEDSSLLNGGEAERR